MNLQEEIDKLPETVGSKDLEPLFLSILNSYNHDSDEVEQKEYVMDMLMEIADKQWHNYEKVNVSLENMISNFVIDLMKGKLTLSLITKFARTISSLGLEDAYKYFKLLMNRKGLENEILNEIKSVINEFGDTVANPYK